MWIFSNHPPRHKTTLHRAECQAKMFGNWIMQHLKLYFLECFFSIYVRKSFKMINIFLRIHNWVIERISWVCDREDNNKLDKFAYDDNNQERKSWTLFGTILFQLSDCLLVPSCVILYITFGCFWRLHLSKTCDESTVWVGILCNAAGYILPSPRLRTE